PHGEAEDAPRRRGEAPSRWGLGVERRTGDVDHRRLTERNRREAGCGAAVGAMVEGAAVGAVERQAMDEAGAALGDEEFLRARIEGEAAERGHTLRRGIDGREQRHLAGDAVNAPDRAGTTALLRRTELPGQELSALGAGVNAL